MLPILNYTKQTQYQQHPAASTKGTIAAVSLSSRGQRRLGVTADLQGPGLGGGGGGFLRLNAC